MNAKANRTVIPFIGSISTRSLSVGFLIIVAASYTLLSVGSRLLAEGFQPMTQVYMRVTLGTLALVVLLWKNLRWHHMGRTPTRDLLILLSMGTLGYSVAVYFITMGVLNAKLVNVAVIFATVPFFSYLYAYIFLRKPFNPNLTALLLVSLFGISVVASKSFIPALGSFGSGEWYSILATATMAWFYVGRKMLSAHLNTSEITIFVMCIAAVSGLGIAVLRGETFALSAFTNPHVLLGLAIGSLMNALVNPIEIFAFEHLDAVLGSQILLLENVFSLIAGYLLYAETLTGTEIIGGCIIVGSVYIANRLTQ